MQKPIAVVGLLLHEEALLAVSRRGNQYTLMEWACAAGAYAAWLAGEDPTEWRNARSSDEAVMVKKRASLERLVGGPLEEDVKEFTGVLNHDVGSLPDNVVQLTPLDTQMSWLPRLPADTRRGFCPTFPDGGKRLFTIKPVTEPAAPGEDAKLGGKLGFRCWEHILTDPTPAPDKGFLVYDDATTAVEPDAPATPTETDPNLIPKFGEVWISKDRRRANYFTVRSVNLKDGEVHTSDHRTIKLSRMSRYRKLK